jgi:hypothetical protein
MSVIRDEADVDLYGQAAAHFLDEQHHQDVRGGVPLIYVDGETVITRLNETFGLFGWKFEILDDGIYEHEEAWCRGRLTIYKRLTLAQAVSENGDVTAYREVVHETSREQYGSQKLKRSRSTGTVLDIGFDKKGAATDCLKKCASLVGVALYLWNKEETAMVKWQLQNAHHVDSTSSTPDQGRPAPPRALSEGATPPVPRGREPLPTGQPSAQPGQAPAPRRAAARPGAPATTALVARDGALIINGLRMPDGFQQPFAIVTQGKSQWQCRAEQCEATVEAGAEYKVGNEVRSGRYILDRAKDEAGAVLCVPHMSAWYKAKQAAGKDDGQGAA